jgi:quinol monooxygenase YgiN
MPVVIAGEIDMAPGVREATLRDARPLIEAALAETGCVHYAWTADPELPDRIHVFEHWDAEADLTAHLVGQPYLKMAGHLAAAGIVHAVTRKYRVDLIEPVYDPAGKPRADFFTAEQEPSS